MLENSVWPSLWNLWSLLFTLPFPQLLSLLPLLLLFSWEIMTVSEAYYCVLILWDESDKPSHPGEASNLQYPGGVDQSIQNCQESVHYFHWFPSTIRTIFWPWDIHTCISWLSVDINKPTHIIVFGFIGVLLSRTKLPTNRKHSQMQTILSTILVGSGEEQKGLDSA